MIQKNQNKSHLGNYVKLIVAVVLIILAWLFPASNAKLWPRIVVILIAAVIIFREIKSLGSSPKAD